MGRRFWINSSRRGNATRNKCRLPVVHKRYITCSLNARLFSALGPIESVLYRWTSPGGYDTYRVSFSKGRSDARLEEAPVD